MELKLVDKVLGVSWLNWFIQTLKHNDFTLKSTNTYVHTSGIEVRIFRGEKYYQVKHGDKLSNKFDFIFPHLTKVLYA